MLISNFIIMNFLSLNFHPCTSNMKTARKAYHQISSPFRGEHDVIMLLMSLQMSQKKNEQDLIDFSRNGAFLDYDNRKKWSDFFVDFLVFCHCSMMCCQSRVIKTTLKVFGCLTTYIFLFITFFSNLTTTTNLKQCMRSD